ncbi:SRPBCC domain-containing protein [Kitasatospora sp. NPDC091207]|uniref:SRPBCC domain-containing protein n=1 Tax=Kitasatospora sp. NPDC091207 TaxID=3364083 RepID=UPI0037F451E0
MSRSRDAQRRPCHLEPEALDLMTVWIERYRPQAEERFGRLDAVLAAMDGEQHGGGEPEAAVARPTPPGPRTRTARTRAARRSSVMTTTHDRRTVIEADPVLPVIRAVREFDAPPGRVFRAWTEPELVTQWLGPKDRVMRIDVWDARTGGTTATPLWPRTGTRAGRRAGAGTSRRAR